MHQVAKNVFTSILLVLVLLNIDLLLKSLFLWLHLDKFEVQASFRTHEFCKDSRPFGTHGFFSPVFLRKHDFFFVFL